MNTTTDKMIAVFNEEAGGGKYIETHKMDMDIDKTDAAIVATAVKKSISTSLTGSMTASLTDAKGSKNKSLTRTMDWLSEKHGLQLETLHEQD